MIAKFAHELPGAQVLRTKRARAAISEMAAQEKDGEVSLVPWF